MQMIRVLVLVGLCLTTGCTKKNELFCCVTAEDCDRLHVPSGQLQPCSDGEVCVQNYCVAASCEDSACPATAPVCDKASDTCGGCADEADCTLFPGRGVCNTQDGACVECTEASQCGPAAPVCDSNACRKCARDSECDSGACADDGTCVAEADVVYLAPTGVDVAPCSRAQPCLQVAFAVLQTTSARTHIVLAAGLYEGQYPMFVTPTTTTAATLAIHGGGAHLVGGFSDGFLNFSVPTTFRDLEVENPLQGDGSAFSVGATCTIERVRIRANTGLFAGGQLTLRDVTIEAATRGIRNNGGSITIDRATIRGGVIGIDSQAGNLDITNLLLHGTTGVGIDITDTTATIKFSTVANAGTGGASTPSIRRSGASVLTIKSSIVWTPTNPIRPGIEGAVTLATSIVGPMAVAGAMNNDPSFVDPLADYHLTPSSIAHDLVDSGPAFDFEGEPRPRGMRYDIGADEGL